MSTPAAIFNKDVEISGNSDLIIKSGGNLGIGKTPSSQIDVSGSGNFSESLTVQNTKIGGNYPNFASFAHSSNNDSNNYSLLQSGSGKTFLNASSDQSIAFSINHTEKMVLDKDGNIGIGTNSPGKKLHVRGNSVIGSNVNNITPPGVSDPSIQCANIVLHNNTSGDQMYIRRYHNGSSNYQIQTGNNNGDLHLQPYGGNIGIGKTNPSTKLDVDGSGEFSGNLAVSGTITGDLTGDVTGNASSATALQNARTIGGISFDGTSNIDLSGVNQTGNQDIKKDSLTFTSTNGPMSFRQAGNAEIMRLTQGKNVGIGTNPSTKLDVDGSGNFSGNLDICGNVKIGPNGTYQHDSTLTTSLLIHEPGMGKEAARDTGTIMLTHQDVSGHSSIVFRSGYHIGHGQNDYAAIDYTSNEGSNTNKSVLRIISNNDNGQSHEDNIALTTNNTDRLTVQGDGNIGIGTTNPSVELDVSGEGKFSGDLTIDGSLNIHNGLKVYYDSGISANQILSSGKSLYLKSVSGNNNSQFQIQPSAVKVYSNNFIYGNTLTASSGKLDISGDVSFSRDLDICGNVKIGPNGTYSSNGSLNTSLLIHEPGMGKEAARNTGTIMLSHQDVSGHSSIVFRSGYNTSGVTNDYAAIDYTSNEGGVNNSILRIIANNNTSSVNEDKIIFTTNNKDRLTVRGNGYIGIGITNPSKNLDVSGDGNFSGDLNVTGTISGNGSGLTSLSASNITGSLLVSKGGTGATSASGARNNLGLGTSDNPQFATVGLGTASNSNFSLNTNSAMRIRATPVNQVNANGPERGVLVLHSEAGIGSNSQGGASNFSIEPSGNILTLSRNGGSSASFPLGCIFNLSRWEHNGTRSRSRLAFRLNHVGVSGDNETDYNTAMVICSNNSVGISKTNPSVELDVSGDGNFSGDLTVGGSLNIGSITDVETYVNDISSNLSNLSQDKIEHGNSNVTVESSSGPISFDTNGSERMRILTNGNVGIGTNNPGEKLELNGNLRLDNGSTGSGHAGARLIFDNGYNKRGPNKIALHVGSGAGGSEDKYGFGVESSTVSYHSANYHKFYSGLSYDGSTGASGTPNMTISSGGKVGIGTDPSKELEVDGDVSFSGDLTVNGDSSFNGNVEIYGGDLTVDNGEPPGQTKGGVIKLDDSHQIRFKVGKDGQNNVLDIREHGRIRFFTYNTEKMCILQNGNVGIGTTNPLQKLHVNGKIRANEIDCSNNSDFIIKNDASHNSIIFRVHNDVEALRIRHHRDTGYGYLTGPTISSTIFEDIEGTNQTNQNLNNTIRFGGVYSGVNFICDANGYNNKNTVIPEGFNFFGENKGVDNTRLLLMYIQGTTGNVGIKGKLGVGVDPSNSNYNLNVNGDGKFSGDLDVTGTITGDLTGDVTGNASSATALETTRTIGDVSFNGTSSIDLPGVNKAGNQNISRSSGGLTLKSTAGASTLESTVGNVVLEASNASNHIIFRSGGNDERMRIKSDGNVGIGTNNPSTNLDVTGDGKFSGDLTVNGTIEGGATRIIPATTSDNADYYLIFNVSTTEKKQPKTNSNIKVNPSTGTLSVKALNILDGVYKFITSNGSGTDLSKTINYSYLDLNHNNYGYRIGGSHRSGDGGIFTLESNQNNSYTERFRIDHTGKVGIGSTNPSVELDVIGDGKFSGDLDVTGTITGDLTGAVTGNASSATALQNARTIGGVSFNGTSSIDLPGVNIAGNQNISRSSGGLTLESTGGSVNITSNGAVNLQSGSSNAIVFKTGGSNERMRIKNNGSVGIGTTNPSKELEVIGDINFTGYLYQNGSLFSGSIWNMTGNKIYYDNGNVGIGTTNPNSAQLQIRKNAIIGEQNVNIDITTSSAFSNSFTQPTALSIYHLTDASNITSSGVGLTSNNADSTHLRGYTYFQISSNNSVHKVFYKIDDESILNLQNGKSYVIKFTFFSDKSSSSISNQDIAQYYFLEESSEITNFSSFDLSNETVKIGLDETKRVVHSFDYYSSKYYYIVFSAAGSGSSWEDIVIAWDDLSIEPYDKILSINGKTEISSITNERGQGAPLKLRNNNVTSNLDERNLNYNHNNVLQMERGGLNNYSYTLSAYMALNRGNSATNAHLIFKVNSHRNASSANSIASTYRNDFDNAIPLTMTGCGISGETHGYVGIGDYFIPTEALEVSGNAKIHHGHLEVVDGSYNFITSTDTGSEYVIPHNSEDTSTPGANRDIKHCYLDLNHNNYGYRIGGSDLSGCGVFTLSDNYNGTYTERFRIDSSGNVGVGTKAPYFPMHVYTATRLGFNANDFAVVDFVDDTAISGRKYGVLSSQDHRHFEDYHVDRILRVIAMNKIAQDSDQDGNNIYGNAGSVGVDTDDNTDPTKDLTALVVPQIDGADLRREGISLLTHGTIYSKTNIIYASDERIKTNITDISDNEALNIFRQIRPVTYNYIDTEKRGNNKIYGFLAQEIKQILPHAVNINENEYIPNIYKIANYNSETKQLHFFSDISCDIDFNRNENDISYVNLKLYSMKNNDVFGEEFSVKCLHQIDSRTLQLHGDTNVTPYTLYDSSRNVLTDVSGNRYENLIFVFGQEIFDFNSLNKSAIWTITTAATQEIDRQLVDAKAQIETQKTQIETLTNLIETLTKRVELLEQN